MFTVSKRVFIAAIVLVLFFSAIPSFSQLEPALAEDRGAALDEVPSDVKEKGKSVFVAIGIDNYVHWQKLHNAVSDATAVQAVFVEKLGFTAPVPPLLDQAATKSAIQALVDDHLRKILTPDDRLVLFVAGHGHTRVDTVGNHNIETGFIVPVGARTGSEEQWSDYVKLDDFLETIGRLPARHVLVILDSCHSGFAVGSSMKSFRSVERYKSDLANKVSRRVITSAMREQLASDNGPIPKHSLFAGILINGLNCGKSDIDRNGLVTSSELSLYIQQQVGESSQSKQTPDFGSFHYDDRGELGISLNSQTFDALKARAINALHRGSLNEFRMLTQEVTKSRPNSAEALYLQYRLLLYDRNITEARAVITLLRKLHLQQGVIPLSTYDLDLLNVQLPYWEALLKIPDGESPILFELATGGLRGSLRVQQPNQGEGLSVYSIKPRGVMQVKIRNESDQQLHVYMIQIDSDGRVMPIRLWEDSLLWSGLPPKSFQNTLDFRDGGQIGMSEWRFLASTERLTELLSPLAYGSRGISLGPFRPASTVRVKTIRYVIDRGENTPRPPLAPVPSQLPAHGQ
ncbi:MAG: caspase family protein [Nitrospira sp.]